MPSLSLNNITDQELKDQLEAISFFDNHSSSGVSHFINDHLVETETITLKYRGIPYVTKRTK
jgi:hypothetical protein